MDMDGFIDIHPKEKLKMTDWHWFDWLNRPGVVTRENPFSCFAGRDGCPQPANKEAIMYKIMSGDTTNLSEDEKQWFFHTANPQDDLDLELNPHFDSLDGLHEETVVTQDPYG